MMNFLTTAEQLLTWLDVERLLKQQTQRWSRLPAGIHAIDCFAEGMDILHSCDEADIKIWLQAIFGMAYNKPENTIRLRIGEAKYQITCLKVTESEAVQARALPTYPLWRDITYLLDFSEQDDALLSESPASPSFPSPWNSGPPLVSFHSFKGGVGRTTALMAYVAACLYEGQGTHRKILIVDADLEAPGVSFWLDDSNRPKVSFVQLLEALHYPPNGVDASLEFFADELRKTSLNVTPKHELFILPAALELGAIQDMSVQPEHLARNPANPWILSDHLHDLGDRLGVKAVFIDLRAGLSELASPILFDPRINHFFVSTVATQSVTGMTEVLKRLHAFNVRLNSAARAEAKPSLILSLLTQELRDAPTYEKALKTFEQAYPADPDDPLSSGVEWLEAEFLSSLMSISSIREALNLLKQPTQLYAGASEWAKALYAPTPIAKVPVEHEGAVPSERQTKAEALFNLCKQAQFAENDPSRSMLATEPLQNLGKHFSKELPNTVVVGAKGAGKTFTFRQVVLAQRWPKFLEKVGLNSESVIGAAIFPVLWSENIADRPEGEIKIAQKACLDEWGQKPLIASEVKRQINIALTTPTPHWEDFWDDLICQQFGITEMNLVSLNERLMTKGKRVILVFDGIEDAFNDLSKEEARNAIQALLKLPNRLSELENRHLGAVIFVRADYVQTTIRQNYGQFMQRYLPFQLQWNPESFLRLAYWLGCHAKIFPDDPKEAENLQWDELKTKLERLWGRKLGKEKSKEAHSARWVYAALCDLKGNIQARDLVRFLRFASSIESKRTGESWPDRILAPTSMREAIPRCSFEKVEEAQKEIAALRDWMKKLDDAHITNRKTPFNADSMLLNTEMLNSLQEIGIIYEDLDGGFGEERLFLPEIYRSGLKFETSTGGRPRMQALLKKNLGSMPL